VAAGITIFPLQPDRFYYLKVVAPGYEDYDGSDDEFIMISGDTVYKTVPLAPIVV
jgi:hypothetical protein